MEKETQESQPISAWLIQWEGTGNRACAKNPYIDIVSSRKSVIYIAEYVQRLHNVFRLSLMERLPSERYINPSRHIHEAKVVKTSAGDIEIHCGHDPYIVARRVRNLLLRRTRAGNSRIAGWEPYQK